MLIIPYIFFVGSVPALWTVLLGLKPLKDTLHVEDMATRSAHQAVSRR